MIENVVTMKITGSSAGSVTYRKRPQVPAPSMVADSCCSTGMVCSPARIEMPKNGRPRHVLTMMIEIMAMVGVPSHDGPVLASPLTTSKRLKRPMPGSRIHCHATVLSTVGTMNGSRSEARVRAFIRKLWFITSAMPRPPLPARSPAMPRRLRSCLSVDLLELRDGRRDDGLGRRARAGLGEHVDHDPAIDHGAVRAIGGRRPRRELPGLEHFLVRLHARLDIPFGDFFEGVQGRREVHVTGGDPRAELLPVPGPAQGILG